MISMDFGFCEDERGQLQIVLKTTQLHLLCCRESTAPRVYRRLSHDLSEGDMAKE